MWMSCYVDDKTFEVSQYFITNVKCLASERLSCVKAICTCWQMSCMGILTAYSPKKIDSDALLLIAKDPRQTEMGAQQTDICTARGIQDTSCADIKHPLEFLTGFALPSLALFQG